jgi:hypothetical protein
MIARWVQPFSGTSFEYRIPHPRFGWVLAPGASYVNRLPEESVLVSYNSEGWRDRPHTRDKPNGVMRVLVLGDSFMEAYSVRFEDALPVRLEHLTSTVERPVEVINFGVGGYGTLQEYLVFNAFWPAYQPDVVVLAMFFANDLQDNSLELASGGDNILKAKARPFLDPQVREPGWRITQVDFQGVLQRYEEYKRRQAKSLNRLVRSSALLQLGQRSWVGLPEPWWKPKTGASPEKKHPTKFRKYYCSQPPKYERAWDVTRRILKCLDREVRAAGGRLLVMSVPWIQEINEDVEAVMRGVMREAPQEAERLCVEEPPAYRRLSKLLGELNIDYLDLLPEFRKRGGKPALSYLDVVMTPIGTLKDTR